MPQTIFDRLQEKKKRLDEHRPLSKSVLERLQKQIALDWTYNTNAIEGNSLTLRETQLVLEEGMTIKGKSLREHFEAKNHEKAIQFLMQLVKKKTLLTEKLILELHALVLDGIEEDFAGRYRNGRVRITGANFVPPNPLRVPDLMDELIRWVKKNVKKLDPPLFAAQVHHRFVWIHPFFDGNGRTGRLIMNLFLMQNGYPPAVILKNDRKKYYDALNEANNGNTEKMELLLAQALERSLNLYLEACSAPSPKEEHVLLSELAQKTPYSQEYLSLLVRRGKIDGFKMNRNWYSSLAAVEAYSQRY